MNGRTETRDRAGRRRALRSAAALALAAAPVAGQGSETETTFGGWWVGVDAGYAVIDADDGPGGSSDGGWVLAFRGGRVLAERWRLGLELGGVTFEPGDLWDPEEGRALSDVLLQVDYRVSPDHSWFLHGAAGWIGYHDNSRAGEAFEGSGWGGRIGIGYGWRLEARGSVALLACWEAGSIDADSGDDWSYDAPRLTVGWSLP